jgi:hypothetical protein
LPGDSTLYLEGTFSPVNSLSIGWEFCKMKLKVTIPYESPKGSETNDEHPSGLGAVRTLPPDESFRLYSTLKSNASQDEMLDLHLARLDSLIHASTTAADQDDCSDNSLSELSPVFTEIANLADTILASINQAQVLTYFGTKSRCVEDESFPKQRAAIVKALVAKGLALVMSHYLEAGHEDEEEPFPDTDNESRHLPALDKIYEDLRLHADPSDSKVIYALLEGVRFL